MYEIIREALNAARSAIVEHDELAAQKILHFKDDVNQLIYEAVQSQSKRISSEGADNVVVTMFENELIDSMKRIYSLTKRIARLTLPPALIEESA